MTAEQDLTPGPGAAQGVAASRPATATASPEAVNEAWRSAERPLYLPWGLRMTAAWIGLLVIIGGGLWIMLRAASPLLGVVVVPCVLAILLTALLKPLHRRLARRMKPMLAAVLTVLITIAVIGAAVTVVTRVTAGQAGELAKAVQEGYQRLIDWLNSGPFGLDPGQLPTLIEQAVDQLVSTVRGNYQQVIGGTLTVAISAGSFVVGLVMTVFILIFLLGDGRVMAKWLVGLLPEVARPRAWGATEQAWLTLGGYVRAQVLVAFVDASGIAIGAAILRVPLALPIGVLVFLGSFVPIVGAFVTGMLAIFLALISGGPITAVLMLAVVLLVQQVESNLLQPLLMGKAVSLHPVAVILAVAAGSTLLGVFGAVIAVPVAAVVNQVRKYLSGELENAADAPPTRPNFLIRWWRRLRSRGEATQD